MAIFQAVRAFQLFTGLARLKQEGLDAVEVRHPRHAPETRSRIAGIASALDLARTGGSDWHGDSDRH